MSPHAGIPDPSIMSLLPDLKRQNRKQWGFALALLLFGIALEAGEAEAQSGRRAAKPTSPVTSVPPAAVTSDENPNPDLVKTPTPDQLSSKVRLLVARQPTSKHFHTEDQILASFVKHLNQYENIEATSIGDTKEGQAVERAKSETEAFVIFMKFDVDSFQNGTIIMNSQDLQIEYFVLAPHTGKRQTKGKVYFQGIGGGRMRRSNWPNGTPIRITPEAAGIEAADGLYFWLKLAALQNQKRTGERRSPRGVVVATGSGHSTVAEKFGPLRVQAQEVQSSSFSLCFAKTQPKG